MFKEQLIYKVYERQKCILHILIKCVIIIKTWNKEVYYCGGTV